MLMLVALKALVLLRLQTVSVCEAQWNLYCFTEAPAVWLNAVCLHVIQWLSSIYIRFFICCPKWEVDSLTADGSDSLWGSVGG